MADYLKIAEVAAAAAVGVALVVVGALQYSVYRQQAAILQADHRPWISASPITLVGNLTHDESGLQMTMMFPLKNTGHSPSRHAFASFTSSLQGVGADDYRKVCGDAEGSRLGHAIFPGDVIDQGVGGKIPEAEFVEAKKQAANGAQINSVLPSVIACIAYKDMENDTFHHTSYNFYLALAGDHSPVQMMIDQKVIPAGSMILISLPSAPAPD